MDDEEREGEVHGRYRNCIGLSERDAARDNLSGYTTTAASCTAIIIMILSSEAPGDTSSAMKGSSCLLILREIRTFS